eukprot:jgi/Botrbrau1/19034/Bobra.0100s0062.1
MTLQSRWCTVVTGSHPSVPHIKLQLVARVLLALVTAVSAQTPVPAPSALPPSGTAAALLTPASAPGVLGVLAPVAAPSEATTADGPTLQKVRYWLGSPPFKGWVEGSDPCTGWQGVGCKDGRVVSLSLDGLGLKGSLPPDVADLGYLQVLNLSSNSFTGALPDNWGYPGALPNVTVLLLDSNQLQGDLPAGWANSGSLANLVLLNIANNNLSGHLPDNWGSGGLVNLRVLSLKHNMLSGSLPATWGNGNWSLPNLAILALDNNMLSGPLPDDWSQGWGSLSLLSLTHNLLEGSLPAAWGEAGFPKLQILSINNNMFSGGLPSSWAGSSTFPAMRSPTTGVVLFPGNDNMTGTIPAASPVQILKFDAGNRYIRCTYLPCLTDVALAMAPAPLGTTVLPMLAPGLAPSGLPVLGSSPVPAGATPGAKPPAVAAVGGPKQTLAANINLVGPELSTSLSETDRDAIVKTAATEAGVDPASVSIAHVTDLSKAAPAPAFSVVSARRLLAEVPSAPGVQLQLLINGTADTIKKAQTSLESSVNSGAFLAGLKKAGVKVDGLSLGNAPPQSSTSGTGTSLEATPATVDRSSSQRGFNKKGAIIGIVLGCVAAIVLIGLLVWLLVCRKRGAKVQKQKAPKTASKTAAVPAVVTPADKKADKKKDSPQGPLVKDSPPKQPIQTAVPESKKGDPPAPSTPPGVTPTPAVGPHTPQVPAESNQALTRALSESHSGKTNVVPYSEYRKKRLENIRKESGLEGGPPPPAQAPQKSGRPASSLLETR